ncbi:MAG: protocatechuate 3,4-dioxygenase subunit alpha [Acidothermaceae bacterium]
MSERLGCTPSQTVGPFLHIALPWPDGPFVVPEDTPGAFWLRGKLFDGAEQAVPDGLIETWQADPNGRFDHPDDPRGAAKPATTGFRGFGRAATEADGSFAILTVKPGPLPSPDGPTEAPHIDVSVFARGLLDRVVTRIYFPDEQTANEVDPVLASIDDARLRSSLVASACDDGSLRFDIYLQGAHETAFFEV